MATVDGWRKLASFVYADRTEHDETQRRAGIRYGLSERVMRQLESARPHRYSDETKYRVEIALEWAAMSFDRVVDGRNPIPSDPAMVRVINAWPFLDDVSRDAIASTAEKLRRSE